MTSDPKTPFELLNSAIQAFNDWTHTYAPEFCHHSDVVTAKARIAQSGGTVAYTEKQIGFLRSFVEFQGQSLSDQDGHAIADAMKAFQDWSATCEDSVCDEHTRNLVCQKMINSGGTIACIADSIMSLRSIRDNLA